MMEYSIMPTLQMQQYMQLYQGLYRPCFRLYVVP